MTLQNINYDNRQGNTGNRTNEDDENFLNNEKPNRSDSNEDQTADREGTNESIRKDRQPSHKIQ